MQEYRYQLINALFLPHRLLNVVLLLFLGN